MRPIKDLFTDLSCLLAGRVQDKANKMRLAVVLAELGEFLQDDATGVTLDDFSALNPHAMKLAAMAFAALVAESITE